MLVPTLEPGKQIYIGDDVFIELMRPGFDRVRIGIDAPKSTLIETERVRKDRLRAGNSKRLLIAQAAGGGGSSLRSTPFCNAIAGIWPDQAEDLLYPRDGNKDRSGNENRIKDPGYDSDAYGITHHPLTTIANKKSPLFEFARMAAAPFAPSMNKDCHGVQTVDTSAAPETQLKQVIKGWVQAMAPFTQQRHSDFWQRRRVEARGDFRSGGSSAPERPSFNRKRSCVCWRFYRQR